MFLIELAIGIAIAFVVLVFLAALAHIILWSLLLVLTIATIAFFLIQFPFAILLSVIIVAGVASIFILGIKSLIALGRWARLSFTRHYRSPPKGPPS